MNTQAQLSAQLGMVCDRAARVCRATADHVEPGYRMTPEQIDVVLSEIVQCAENARDLWKGAPA